MSQWTTSANYASRAGYAETAGSSVSASGVWIDKSANYTLLANDQVRSNSQAGGFDLTLPAAPVDKETVKVADTGFATTNNVNILRNGNTINRVASDQILNINYVTLEFKWFATDNTWIMKVL